MASISGCRSMETPFFALSSSAEKLQPLTIRSRRKSRASPMSARSEIPPLPCSRHRRSAMEGRRAPQCLLGRRSKQRPQLSRIASLKQAAVEERRESVAAGDSRQVGGRQISPQIQRCRLWPTLRWNRAIAQRIFRVRSANSGHRRRFRRTAAIPSPPPLELIRSGESQRHSDGRRLAAPSNTIMRSKRRTSRRRSTPQ